MNVRIKAPRTSLLPGETLVTFTWKNPKPPRPIPDPAKKFEKRQRELDNDPARFKAACWFNGL